MRSTPHSVHHQRRIADTELMIVLGKVILYGASGPYSCGSLNAQSIFAAGNTGAGAAEIPAEGASDKRCEADFRDDFSAGIRHGWMLDWGEWNSIVMEKSCLAVANVDTGFMGCEWWGLVVEDGGLEDVIEWRTVRLLATEDGRDTAGVDELQSVAIGIGIGMSSRCRDRILVGGVRIVGWWKNVGRDSWKWGERWVNLEYETWFT